MLKKLLFVFSIFATNVVNAQLNPTDACGTSVQLLTVGASCSNNSFTLAGTFANGGSPVASCGSGGNDRDDGWYRFVATGTSTDISLSSNTQAFAMAVYTGSCGTGELGCVNQTGTGVTTTLNVATTVATTYYVQIHRRGGNNGADLTGDICIYTPCSAPTTQATVFTSSAISTTTMTVGWTRGNGNRVIVIARAGSAPTDPTSGTTYTANAAYGSGGAVGGGFCVYSGTGTSVNLTGLTAGTTYHFAVYEYNTAGSCYNLTELTGNATTLGGGSNDEPCSATPIVPGVACVYSVYSNATATATAGPPAPGCSSYLGGDVWFTFVVPASGAITINSNTGVITDGGMAIYSGNCGALVLIECDDDDSPNGLMPQIIRTGLTPGNTIWIRFWEYGNDNNGTFSLCVYDHLPAPTCFDGIMNGTETGIDCGGSCVAICPPPSCVDGIMNGTETGIDCGGTCPACPTNVIPTACTTTTYNLVTPAAIFYDDGGPGGNLCADPGAGNFCNCNCKTINTFCAPVGSTLVASFNSFAMFNTTSAFDWMKIYDSNTVSGTVLFNNGSGGPNNPMGDCGTDPLFQVCSTNRCLTFEFFASGVVNRAGWEVKVSQTTSYCYVPLSVKLSSFDAENKNNKEVNLSWITESEKKSSTFEIERSTDLNSWSIIARIKSKGKSDSSTEYLVIDDAPLEGDSYYRLKYTDIDGEKSYSDIESISINKLIGENLKIYPVPSSDFLKIEGRTNELESIEVFDLTGKNINSEITFENTSEYSIKANISNLPKGVYAIKTCCNYYKFIVE